MRKFVYSIRDDKLTRRSTYTLASMQVYSRNPVVMQEILKDSRTPGRV